MRRRYGTGRLRSARREYTREDINPLTSLVNLTDAMLVLAVGVMIAVVIGWNVDIRKVGSDTRIETIQSEDLETVDPGELQEGQSELEEVGTLLYDKATGTYYVVE